MSGGLFRCGSYLCQEDKVDTNPSGLSRTFLIFLEFFLIFFSGMLHHLNDILRWLAPSFRIVRSFRAAFHPHFFPWMDKSIDICLKSHFYEQSKKWQPKRFLREYTRQVQNTVKCGVNFYFDSYRSKLLLFS